MGVSVVTGYDSRSAPETQVEGGATISTHQNLISAKFSPKVLLALSLIAL